MHAHDWLVAWAGDTLHELYGVPLVATIHATERGRNGGTIPPGQPAGIHAVEWWLTYQAHRVIACSQYMVDEIVSSFDLPRDKIDVIPNGVDPEVWAPPVAGSPARRARAGRGLVGTAAVREGLPVPRRGDGLAATAGARRPPGRSPAGAPT